MKVKWQVANILQITYGPQLVHFIQFVQDFHTIRCYHSTESLKASNALMEIQIILSFWSLMKALNS